MGLGVGVSGRGTLAGGNQGAVWGHGHVKSRLGEAPRLSLLTGLLAGLRVSLALGWGHQLLVTWNSSQGCSKYGSPISPK